MPKKSSDHLLLGAHISIEGGLYKAIERGVEIGCTALQIFTTSNRQWGEKKLTENDIEQFKSAQKKYGVLVVTHCSYLINLGSPTADVRHKSKTALKEEILRCNALSIPYAILHPGSKLKGSEEESLEWIAQGIDAALEASDHSTMILLETMAGQGSTLGSSFEQLAKIRLLSKYKKLIGICADTCHLFASGYNFTTHAGYEAMLKKFDATIGLKHLKVIHMNDSKKECGEKFDRHEDIGMGKIGKEAFVFIMNDARFL
jgi:deoxyribonuclease-4